MLTRATGAGRYKLREDDGQGGWGRGVGMQNPTYINPSDLDNAPAFAAYNSLRGAGSSMALPDLQCVEPRLLS